MVNMMNQADLLKDTLESLNVHRHGKRATTEGVPPLPTSSSTTNVHSFVTHAGGTSTSTSYPNHPQEDEDEGGLLVNASLEPISDLPHPETPPVPRIPEDFNPRQRADHHGIDIELENLADDELLDELEDEDLDYEHLRR